MMDFDLNKRHCYYFNEISKIPRGSRNEKAISDYLVSFAKEQGLWYKQDDVYNVIIDKPASEGYENSAPIILQAHIDMVCEKPAARRWERMTVTVWHICWRSSKTRV